MGTFESNQGLDAGVEAKPGTSPREESVLTLRDGQARLLDDIRAIIGNIPATDIHTHLYAPEMGDLLLSGAENVFTFLNFPRLKRPRNPHDDLI